MTSGLKEFLGDVKAARDERAADQKALLARLKRLSLKSRPPTMART